MNLFPNQIFEPSRCFASKPVGRRTRGCHRVRSPGSQGVVVWVCCTLRPRKSQKVYYVESKGTESHMKSLHTWKRICANICGVHICCELLRICFTWGRIYHILKSLIYRIIRIGGDRSHLHNQNWDTSCKAARTIWHLLRKQEMEMNNVPPQTKKYAGKSKRWMNISTLASFGAVWWPGTWQNFELRFPESAHPRALCRYVKVTSCTCQQTISCNRKLCNGRFLERFDTVSMDESTAPVRRSLWMLESSPFKIQVLYIPNLW